MTDPEETEDPALTIAVLADLERLAGSRCARCGATPCGHELVVAIAMGFKDAPCCLGCTATALGRPRAAFREHVFVHIQHRDCFRTGWERASELEGLTAGERPACLWPDGAPVDEGEALAATVDDAPATTSPSPEHTTPDARWDAGDMSCGDLVLELRNRLLPMEPGAVIAVTATDPAAPEDIPAWCRLTRHRLVSAVPPVYLIERRQD